LGQKRRFEHRPMTSGLLSTPDIPSARRHVAKCQQRKAILSRGRENPISRLMR
jgi:hypothetical protein